MMNIYLTNAEGQFREVDHAQRGCWINLVKPTKEEIDYVVRESGIPYDFVRDPLDDDERSRIEEEDGHVLTIVDIPIVVEDETDTALFDTIPLGIIATSGIFVTVCLRDNPIIQYFVDNRMKGFFTYKKTRFTLQLLYVMATHYLRYLRQISRRTTQIEMQLHRSMKNKELFSMLSLEKTLVYFMTSLKANNMVMDKILKQNYFKMYEDDENLLDDAIIENKQAIEMTEIYSNILSGMMNTFASVISNNVNIVMKFLTAVTIIISLPTMVFSFYGMNLNLPLATHSYSFLIVLSLSIIISTTVAYIFWKKRYF